MSRVYSWNLVKALKCFENESPLHIYVDSATAIPYFKLSYAEKHSEKVEDLAEYASIWFDPRPLMKNDLYLIARALKRRFDDDFVHKVLHLVLRGPTMVSTDGNGVADHVYEFFTLGSDLCIVVFDGIELELDVVPKRLLTILAYVEEAIGIVDTDLRVARSSPNGIYAIADKDRIVGLALDVGSRIVEVFRWRPIDPYAYLIEILSRPSISWLDIYRANLDYIENLVEKVRRAVKWLERDLGKRGYLAFSGGKDSVLAAYLLTEAESNFVAVYTHIEHGDPEHVRSYSERIASKLGFELHVVEHRWRDVENHLRVYGMPFRGYRWCTYVFKFYPQMLLAKKLYGLDKIVSYTGSRKFETFKRSIKPATYVDVDLGVVNHSVPYKFPKLLEYLVLAYRYRATLVEDYFLGFERLSCITCPYKSCYELRLARKIYADDFEYWRPYIERLAKSMNIDEFDAFERHLWRLGYQLKELQQISKALGKRISIPIPGESSSYSVADIERAVSNAAILLGAEVEWRDGGAIVRYRECTAFIDTDGVTYSPSIEKCVELAMVIEASLRCTSCSICVVKCEANAISTPFRVDQSKCTRCMKCVESCIAATTSILRMLASTKGRFYAYRWFIKRKSDLAEYYLARARELEEKLYSTKR